MQLPRLFLALFLRAFGLTASVFAADGISPPAPVAATSAIAPPPEFAHPPAVITEAALANIAPHPRLLATAGR